MNDQIIVVDVSIDTTGSETSVIFEPVNASDTVNVTLALIVLRTILCVEVVNPDSIGTISACKEMSTIAEFDFLASLDL